MSCYGKLWRGSHGLSVGYVGLWKVLVDQVLVGLGSVWIGSQGTASCGGASSGVVCSGVEMRDRLSLVMAVGLRQGALCSCMVWFDESVYGSSGYGMAVKARWCEFCNGESW